MTETIGVPHPQRRLIDATEAPGYIFDASVYGGEWHNRRSVMKFQKIRS